MNRVREAREAAGLGLAAAAVGAKITEQQLRKIEKGQHRPHPLTQESLAAVLKRDIHYLFPIEEA